MSGRRKRIAILDDYQEIALQMADWSNLRSKADISVFYDHLDDPVSIIERLKPFDVVCVMRERTRLTRTILSSLPNLKLITSTGHRFNSNTIDVIAAKELGITLCRTGLKQPRLHGTDELTWALILAMIRNLPQELAAVREGKWQVSIGSELLGKTIGIIGLGQIGSSVARIASAFGMNVIAWSQHLTHDQAIRNGAKLVEKEELFRASDIITIHLVLSDRTRGTVGEHEINQMKPTAYLVNTSRGPIVDETALLIALREERIAGAGLDVFDVEPLPANHPFRSLSNVYATPHIGHVTKESYRILFEHTVENIEAWIDGKPIRTFEI